MTAGDAFAELLARVGANRGAPVFIGPQELGAWSKAAVAAMKAQKLLVKARSAASVVCPGCERECVMPVHVPPAQGAAPRAFVVCDKRSDINRVNVLIPPLPEAFDLVEPKQVRSKLVLGYHATHTHFREHEWLSKIIMEVLMRKSGITFQITATGRWARFWRHDERVLVVPVRPWLEYRAQSRSHGIDLLLAPLMPNQINYARSPTKRIDAVRCGAALLVSNEEIYKPSAVEKALGMLVPLESEKWINAICSLIDDRSRMQRLAALNRHTMLDEQRQARAPFKSVPDMNGKLFWCLDISLCKSLA